MNYVQSFDLFGVSVAQIPSITESGVPTVDTEGAVGCLYMDTDTGNLYKCTAVENSKYTWIQVGGNSAGSGITNEEKQLLLSLFRNAAYTTDMRATFAQLEALWGGSGDEPIEPEEPDVPVVTLTSISATYSGGDVPVGTAVSALTGIVVTAHYSDGTSKAVTDYTLSGTIVEGSNTITVSYGGKTATFAVTGVAEYTTYDYIKTTSKNGNALSDAAIYLTAHENQNALSVSFEFMHISGESSYRALFGSRAAGSYTNSFAWYVKDGYFGCHAYGVNMVDNTPATMTNNAMHEVTYTNGGAGASTIELDGKLVYTLTPASSLVNAYPLVLFSNPTPSDTTFNWGNNTATRLGYVNIFDLDGVHLNAWKPSVRNADNVIGMYDSITGVFVTAGTASYATIGNTNCMYEVGNWR